MIINFTSLEPASAHAADVALLRPTTSPSPVIGARERKVDQVLADSFPASDPPPWTLGRVTGPPVAPTDTTSDDEAVWSSHTTVIVSGAKRTAWQWMATGVGALALGLSIPLAILTVGTPVALAARAIIDVAAWLAAVVFN